MTTKVMKEANVKVSCFVNRPMQYTATFTAVKMTMKIVIFFLLLLKT